MGAELFHAGERRADVTKLRVAFRHIANEPKRREIEDEATKGRVIVDFQEFC